MPPFWSRIVISLLLLPLVIGVAYLGGWWLFGLSLVAGLLALHELYRLARNLKPLVLAGYLGFVVALVGAETGGAVWMAGGVLLTLLMAFLLFGLSHERPSATASFGITVLGVVWIGGGLGFLLLLRDIPDHGFWAVIAVLFTVFAADTAAYFVGRTLGRRPLAPVISPAKTWEGFIAGIVAGVLAAFLILYKDRQDFLSVPQTFALGAAVVFAAVCGDLFESAVKRDLHVKDSGRLLGGHGGMLDRLDALLWAGPAAFYVVLAFGAS